jgi:ATP-dependent Clp protease ATP-binding subunit ClpC
MRTNNGFTERAQEALRFAHEIVVQKQHNQLDVEHILLALLKPREGVGNRIIARLSGDPRQLAQRLDDALNTSPRLFSGYGGMGATNIHISMRAQRVVSQAANEAEQMDDEYIGVEHLLLAIAGEREGKAAGLLNEMNIDRDRIYQALREIRAEVLDDTDPHHRLLRRVMRMQVELAELRRDLETLIKEKQTS